MITKNEVSHLIRFLNSLNIVVQNANCASLKFIILVVLCIIN